MTRRCSHILEGLSLLHGHAELYEKGQDKGHQYALCAECYEAHVRILNMLTMASQHLSGDE